MNNSNLELLYEVIFTYGITLNTCRIVLNYLNNASGKIISKKNKIGE